MTTEEETLETLKAIKEALEAIRQGFVILASDVRAIKNALVKT